MNSQIKSNQDTNKNDQKNPYPQILSGSNAADIYPNLDFPLIQKNLTNQSNRELSLSISQIKDQQNSNHLSQNSEQKSNVSVGSRSSKFFNSFNKKKISQQNENENINNSICLKLLQELNENKRQNLVYRSQIYDHNSSDLKQKQENNKLNKTQMFMRRFNNFDSKEKDELQKEPKQNISLCKQKTIKFPFNQISSQNEENLDELTNVINKAKQQEQNIQIQKQQKQQIKQEQYGHKIFISNSHISDNLQSFTEEPILAGMKPISTLFTSEQVFKKDSYHKNNNQIIKNLQDQQQQNSDGVYDQEQDEEKQNSDGVYDQEDEDQSLLKSQHFQIKKQYRQQKQQFRQNTEKIHQQKVILPEKKEQQQEQWSSRGVKQEEDLDDDQEEQDQQQQYQQQQQEQQQQEEDLQMESRNSQIIGIHMLKSFTTQKIMSLKQTTQTYYPSNYFHTGPRYQMLGILRQLIRQRQKLSVNASQNDQRYQTYVNQIQQLENIDVNTYQNIYKDILQDLGQKTRLYLKDDVINQIQSVISQYNSSNYFHVGPRRQMFSWVIYLIQLTQKSRKVIQSKTKSSRNSHRMPPSNREVINNQQQQQQQKRQEQNQEQKQEQVQQLDQNQQLEESFQQQDEQNQDDQEQQANDQINNSIHDFLSNYANNDISVLSTQRSLNIRKKQPQVQIKYTTDDIKNYQIGKNLKQVLTPSLIQSLSRTLMQYNSSNYFHVGPRYQLLGFMEQFAKSVENIVKNGGNNLIDSSVGDLAIKKIIKIGEQVRKYMNDGKIRQIFNICRQYGSSNYFHVGPRYSILGDVRKLISICQV